MNRTLIIAIIVLGAVVLWLSYLLFRKWWMRKQIVAKAARGRRIEDEAGDRLAGLGFAVISQHPRVPYVWTLDGEAMEVNATPDWLVKKDGKTYLVEVKTGSQANPKTAKTRRQMLEYYLYGNVDGVIYYDGDADSVQYVTFPTPIRVRMPLWVWPALIFSSGLAIYGLWKWGAG